METNLTEDDFKDLKYNPFNLGRYSSILTKYPILSKFSEYKEKLDPHLTHEQVLKYIFIMYQESEALMAMETLAERKMNAALAAGFKLVPSKDSTPKFQPLVERILNCEEERVNDMIIRTLRLTRKRAFINLLTYMQAFDSVDRKILDGGTAKEKMGELIKTRENLSELIEKAEREYLNYDTNQNLIEKLYDHVDAKELGIAPEDIAAARAEGRLSQVLPDPYLEDE